MTVYYDGCDWDADGFPGEYVYGDYEYADDYYMDERWKRICDVPGYWVSSKGRVWSSIKNRFIEGCPNDKGYIDFSLKYKGRRFRRYLHRLMAEAFIPNPHNYPEVRHLDDDTSNNSLENLAWGTQQHNVDDCIRNGHFRYFTKSDIERANEIRRTPIVAIRLRDGMTRIFNSQYDAARRLGLEQTSISGVLHGKRRSAGGFFFVFKADYDETIDYHNRSYQRRGIPIKATYLSTGETRIYSKPRQAAFDLDVSEASVSNVLHGKARSAKGWLFEELDTGEEYDD